MTTFQLPEFVQIPPSTANVTMRRHDAAALLQLSYARMMKLISAGLLREPLLTTEVESMARRPFLAIKGDGELTVLRTSPKTAANDASGRPYIGVHVGYDNTELDDTSLAWWRSQPNRVLRNRLFAETVSTFPVAVWDITEHVGTSGADTDLRHRYAGQLLARLRYPNTVPDDEMIIDPLTGTVVVSAPKSLQGDPRLHAAQRIMASRIKVDSGGPIGYLESTSPHTPPATTTSEPLTDPDTVVEAAAPHDHLHQ